MILKNILYHNQQINIIYKIITILEFGNYNLNLQGVYEL